MKSYMDLVYTTEGHPRHKLDLFLPADSKEAKSPLIVWMHGGSWDSGDKNLLPPLQYLCPRFAVASLNYRYVSQALFPAQLHDIKTAVRYLKTVAPEYNLDPNRVVLTGFSAGGHLAALGTLVQGVAELEGHELGYTEVDSSVIGAAVLGAPLDFSIPSPRSAGLRAMLEKVAGLTEEELVRRASPISYVRAGVPPIFVQHGDADPMVAPQHSLNFVAALKKNGVEHVLDIVPGLEHKLNINTNLRLFLEGLLERG